MKPKPLSYLSTVALFFLFSIPSAYAQECDFVESWTGSRPTYGDRFIYRSTVEEYTQYSDPYTSPVGTTLGMLYVHNLAPINSTGPSPMFNCKSKSGSIIYEGSPDFGVPNGNLYASGIAGVGFRIKIHTVNGDFNTGYMAPHSIYYNQTDIYRGKQVTYALIAIIKTGPISIFGPFTGVFAVEKFNNQVLFEYQFSGTFKPTYPQKPTCKMEQVAPVDLGSHAAARFTGTGSVTEAKDFEVNVSCTGGQSNHTAYMTFTDNTDTNSTRNYLLLQASGVSGLGVEILHNGSPVSFGPQTAPITQSNVKSLGTIMQQQMTSFSLPLKARYRQTGNSVTGGGPANAAMLLTVSYP
ncbi:P pilus assembly protein, pilin FimA [Delftia tsuruhatensis]|uniref:fimbrial protein n=1 Tax=Delftia tsuruhatensis TaxID=180282 RepID=UPI001E6F6222|nr:fimbrial protein [Delftia tsuruhatensis]CAB5715384.1 P pilus assembly protein, pilin FimA [Delftia tsuruhatensis]CAC9676712.1 P pilus assembly protein, pilin FimA [Delftia tsuruhatensis]